MKDYKEILKGIVGIIRTTEKSDIGFANICTYIGENCPELQENEDERIRKALIQGFFEYDNSFATFGGIKVGDIIAWLEKQGEQKPYGQKEECFNCQFNYAGHCKGYCELKRQDKSTFDQCKQEGDRITANSDGTHFNISQLERVAKVEPKFHEDDWIVEPREGEPNGLWHIERIEDNNYWEGCVGVRIEHADKYYHPWAIQEAKDGDVLVDVYGNISIYEKCDDFDWKSYCSLGHNGGFQPFEIEHENEKTYPATKEQRDALFVAMKTEGYEWDADKKELIKIKQKPKWSEEYERHENTIISAIHGAGNITPIDGELAEKWLKSLKRRLQ